MGLQGTLDAGEEFFLPQVLQKDMVHTCPLEGTLLRITASLEQIRNIYTSTNCTTCHPNEDSKIKSRKNSYKYYTPSSQENDGFYEGAGAQGFPKHRLKCRRVLGGCSLDQAPRPRGSPG